MRVGSMTTEFDEASWYQRTGYSSNNWRNQANGFGKRRNGTSSFESNIRWVWEDSRLDARRIKSKRRGRRNDFGCVERHIDANHRRNRLWKIIERENGGVTFSSFGSNMYETL